jgi:hypothetical protein
MAIVKQGDALETPKLQPGAKFQTDGYGLWTGTLTFKIDKAGSSSSFYRGAPCPITAFNFCKMHKTSVAIGELQLDTWSADYVGIDPGFNSGSRTNPQVGVSQGLTSEHISTHTNFFTASSGIAGPTPFTASTIVPTEFKGLNGAHFEKASGGKFLGFKDPASPLYYGKTNYLAPQTSFAGFFYTSTQATPKALAERVGKTSGNGSFNSIALLPDYMGTSFVTGTGSRSQLLLAQVNVEDFGLLYKVNYEIRYNRDGYVSTVYPAA